MCHDLAQGCCNFVSSNKKTVVMRNVENTILPTLSDCISSNNSLRVLVDMMADMDLELLDVAPAAL